ncbi:MAG: FkbM family methyltransferase [Candidatus Bathyarchaeia archaeon]
MSFLTEVSNPILLFSGIYLSSEGLVVFARGKTEDLYYLLPKREEDVDFLIKYLLRPGDVFVDVGANVGYYTLLAAKKGCKVVAIEPIPQTNTVLRINLRLNRLGGNVDVINKCAWSSKKSMKLIIPQGKYYGLSRVLLNDIEGIVVEVECIDLDSVLHDQLDVRMIKIDVEGAEYEVLRGARETLRKTNFVIIELSRNMKDTVSFLLEMGYRVKRLRFATYILAYNKIKLAKDVSKPTYLFQKN